MHDLKSMSDPRRGRVREGLGKLELRIVGLGRTANERATSTAHASDRNTELWGAHASDISTRVESNCESDCKEDLSGTDELMQTYGVVENAINADF